MNLTGKYPNSLILRLSVFLVLILTGIGLVIGGTLHISVSEIRTIGTELQIETIQNTDNIETKEPVGYPEFLWLETFDFFIEPRESNFLMTNEKIKIQIHATSDYLPKEFSVYVFHESKKDEYEKSSNEFLNMQIQRISPKTTEWESYIKSSVNHPDRCTRATNSSYYNVNGCTYDIGGSSINKFTNPGNYHALFVIQSENNTRFIYNTGSIFSLRDSFDVSLFEQTNEISNSLKFLQIFNQRSEGYAYIGIGIALIIGSLTLLESFTLNKKQYDEDHALYVDIFSDVQQYFRSTRCEFISLFRLLDLQNIDSFRRISTVLAVRGNSLVNDSHRIEGRITFLQQKQPDLVTRIRHILEGNRTLLHSSYFENTQHGFEFDTIRTWISDSRDTLNEIDDVNSKIVKIIQ